MVAVICETFEFTKSAAIFVHICEYKVVAVGRQ